MGDCILDVGLAPGDSAPDRPILRWELPGWTPDIQAPISSGVRPLGMPYGLRSQGYY